MLKFLMKPAAHRLPKPHENSRQKKTRFLLEMASAGVSLQERPQGRTCDRGQANYLYLEYHGYQWEFQDPIDWRYLPYI